jgi:Zn finger protein HypA/HybF involved in hydrogenase expression
MKYLAICHDCGKLLGETKEFGEEEVPENLGQMIKIASMSFKECPRCGSDKITLKKDKLENNFNNQENDIQ